ncbi:MAG: flagellar export chaperone FliS [Clostridia bacterium]|nr:flagellar export chaperone FliS [Clostridia bacterium]
MQDNYASKALGAYQENQVQTLSQEKLVLMLYDGLLRFLGQAQEALKLNRLDQVNSSLCRAEDIVLELIMGLDYSAGPIAGSLGSLYDFMYRELLRANLKKDPQAIGGVQRLVAELRDAWMQAIRVYRSGNYTRGGIETHG